MTSGSINYEFNDWKQKIVLSTCIVEISKIHTNAKLTILLSY